MGIIILVVCAGLLAVFYGHYRNLKEIKGELVSEISRLNTKIVSLEKKVKEG